MGNCKDCKHWIEPPIRHSGLGGQCNRAAFYRSPVVPARVGSKAVPIPFHPDRGNEIAVGTEKDSIEAVLLIAADFGCVQFEAKE